MAILHSSSRGKKSAAKPKKPYKSFPLGPHARGKWCKRIKGKLYYFGTWDDWEGALREYEHAAPYIAAGKTIPAVGDEFTLEDLCEAYCDWKESLLNSGDIVKRTYREYVGTCERVIRHFGRTRGVTSLGPPDFLEYRNELAKTRSANTLGNEINRVRMLFNFAVDEGYIDKAINFGKGFRRPAAKRIRAERNAKRLKNGVQMFHADEINCLLENVKQPLKAMILLGVNCGLGNHDCGMLQAGHLDLDNGWLNYPRPKTEVDRRAKLWPETIETLRESVAMRPKAKTPDAELLYFRTTFGHPWAKETRDNPISKEMRKLIAKCESLEGDNRVKYRGVSFYGLRHTFETIGGESGDQVAVNFVMGHVDASMSAQYREGISDARLERVADTVRDWLFSTEAVK